MYQCGKKFKDVIEKNIKWLVGWVITFIVLFGLLVPIIFLYFRQKELSELGHHMVYAVNVIDEYTLWYYVCLVVITVGLVLIAWAQLGSILNKLDAEYLLEVDNRWHSEQIIEARAVIHILYLQSKEHIKNQSLPNETLKCILGEKIIILSERQDEPQLKNFIYLLNFLDFMESIGYFHSKNYITLQQIEELFGASLKFNYEIFRPYIEHRRISHQNKDFYEKFETLYHQLCKNEHKCLKVYKT